MTIKNALNRFPNTFDDRLEQGFERLKAMAPDGFLAHRSLAHLRVLLVLQFFLQKKIESTLQKERNQNRHIYIRLFRQRSYLCLIFTLSLSREDESISKGSLLKAIQSLLPTIDEIPHSFFKWFHPEIPYICGYLELKKWRGKDLSQNQIRHLSRALNEQLLYSLPVYAPAVFWPYNAEESYRQLLSLKQEIEKESDLPHVTIQFKGQLASSLEFLIHLATANSFSLNRVADTLPSSIRLTHYFSNQTEDQFPIKMHIFSMHIPENQFLENGIVNLMHARRIVAKYLEGLIGSFRDFNGGLLEKQSQQFEEIKARFSKKINSFSLFAEPLFYSLRPIEKQISISLNDIEKLFTLFSKAFGHKGKTIITDPLTSILIMKSPLTNQTLPMAENIKHLSLIYGECVLSGFHYLSVVTQASDFSRVHALLKQKTINEAKVLRLNFFDGPPVSLNPHYIYRDIRCRMLGKLLYEGLTRIGSSGKPILTGAQHFFLRKARYYLFKIRPHFWSNGERVTASHYEQSWKQALCSPDIPSEPFFTLQNAQKIHEDQKSLEELGVQAIDDQTLKITLERPDPFFFEKLAHPLFFPSVSSVQQEPTQFNGPFLIRKYDDEELILESNPYFWGRKSVFFEKICVHYLRNEPNVFEAFERGEIDWIGTPLYRIPSNYISLLRERDLLQQREQVRPFWIYFNTQCYCFTSKSIRQALNFSLDRPYIARYIFKEDIPLYSPLPHGVSLLSPTEKHLDLEQTKQLFKEGVRELGYTLKTFPSIQLSFYQHSSHTELGFYLKKRWEDLFGITIHLKGMSWNQFCTQLDKREFQLAGFSDSVLSRDPLEILTRFEKAHSPYNFSLWEDTYYQEKIAEAKQIFSLETRNEILRKAESILVDGSPVIPIVNHRAIFSHNPKLKGFVFDHGECVDFRWAFFKEEKC